MASLVAVAPDNVAGAPKSDPSILNWTVPVAVPDPGATALTVAVKVADWPTTVGFAEAVSAVVVSGLFAVCVTAAEVLVLKLPSPLYTAVIEWAAAASAVVVKAAWPPLRVLVASAVVPSLKVT